WLPPSRIRSFVDRGAHLLVGATTTDVGDRRIDVGIGRLRLVLEQRRHGHDHAALAVAALRHVVTDPRLLHLGEVAVVGEPFNGDDLLTLGGTGRERARPRWNTIDMDRAGAALRDAATVFRASEADILADRPQQRRVGAYIHFIVLAVDIKTRHSQF